MKKNLKNLMALILTGAMLTAGTSVFAAETVWGGETGGNQTGNLAGSGQTIDMGSSPIRVVVPTKGVDFVIDPEGLLSGADLGDMTVDEAGTVMFLYTNDDNEKVLSNKSDNMSFINKSTIPINLEIEASADTAWAEETTDRAASNIIVTTSDQFNDATKTQAFAGIQATKDVGGTDTLLWKKPGADDSTGKTAAEWDADTGEFIDDDDDPETPDVAPGYTDSNIEDKGFVKAWEKAPYEEHITPQIELIVGIENNSEVAVKAPTMDADGKTIATDGENAVKTYAMIPDASDLIALEYIGDEENPYKFTYNDGDVEDESWPRVNVYVKGNANTSSDWNNANTDNFKLNIKYTLNKAGSGKTYNLAKDTKNYKLDEIKGLTKTTAKLRFRALSGPSVGRTDEFAVADLAGLFTLGDKSVTMTPEAMAVIRDAYSPDGSEVKVVVFGEGSEGKIFSVK